MMPRARLLLPLFVVSFALTAQTPPDSAPGHDAELNTLREAARTLVVKLQQKAPPHQILQLFSSAAFDNPTARKTVDFTGGDATGTPAQMRRRVSEALTKVIGNAAKAGARCPDVEALRKSREDESTPAENDIERDGFSVTLLNDLIARNRSKPAAPGSEREWLRRRIDAGYRLGAMMCTCYTASLVVLWARTAPEPWRVAAFLVTSD